MTRSHPVVHSALLGLGLGLLGVVIYEILSGDPVDATAVGRSIGFAVVLAALLYVSTWREAAQRSD